MKEQRTSYGAEDKRSLVQQIHVLDINIHPFEKNWTNTPSASESYGRLADEMQVKVKIFNILYRLNYSDFYYV